MEGGGGLEAELEGLAGLEGDGVARVVPGAGAAELGGAASEGVLASNVLFLKAIV